MRLGFYYHIPIAKRESGLYLPGYLAVFVDALANEVSHLTLFFHQTSDFDSGADTILQAENITLVSLGKKTPAWHRSIFYSQILYPFLPSFKSVDLLLIRCPSPLAPYFTKVLPKNIKLAYLVVGDYGEGANFLKLQSLRHLLIKYYLRWNDAALKKIVKDQLVLVNSVPLYKLYQQRTSKICLIKTTTLRMNSFWKKKDIELRYPVRLAYIGRFDLHKGMRELVEAVAILNKHGIQIELHLTGWEDSPRKEVENKLKKLAVDLEIDSLLFWHGRKRIGQELDQMYRDADIYVLPSYHEGFPRTIWEAMANSCPVIATHVGAIPYYLEHGKHAWLIEPKSVAAIVSAVEHLVANPNIRKQLIRNGYALAMENTLEVQVKNMVNFLNSEVNVR